MILRQPCAEAEPLKAENSYESDWGLIKMQILGQEVWGGEPKRLPGEACPGPPVCTRTETKAAPRKLDALHAPGGGLAPISALLSRQPAPAVHSSAGGPSLYQGDPHDNLKSSSLDLEVLGPHEKTFCFAPACAT